MRTLAVLGTVAALGLAVAGLGTSAPSQTELTGKCAKANLDLFSDGKLTLATDNPSFPPWWGGNAGHGFDTSDPYSGKGYEGASPTRSHAGSASRRARSPGSRCRS